MDSRAEAMINSSMPRVELAIDMAATKISSSTMLTLVDKKYLCAVALGWLGFAAAAAGEAVIFSAMGCGPYTPADKPAVAFYVRQENRERTSEFMVHLGDVFKMPLVKKPEVGAASPASKPGQIEPPGPDQMPTEAEYRWTADLLSNSNTIPTWIVPGDNEWNDLEDPVQGGKWWQKYYARFEGHFQPAWKTERSPERPENFAFLRKGVVFIGINLVGGRIHDASEWLLRLPQDAAWIKEVLTLGPAVPAILRFIGIVLQLPADKSVNPPKGLAKLRLKTEAH